MTDTTKQTLGEILRDLEDAVYKAGRYGDPIGSPTVAEAQAEIESAIEEIIGFQGRDQLRAEQRARLKAFLTPDGEERV